ncbi:hypothetical protein EJ110_NYTH24498 [Nymphaea thermarum]|nr:hypothetical protein EJ110_NYTH24498 [Nymphaea thermarum]
MTNVTFLHVLPSAAVMLSDDDREQVIVKMKFVLVFIFFKFLHRPRQIVYPYRNAGSQFVHNIINGHPRNCLDLLRMDRNSFITLCNILKEKNLVEDGREINIEEQVAIFLLTIGHNERNRKYYLGDGGYPNIRGLLTPYRGHRYHLSEFNALGARRVTSKEELFNHCHSSLRTTVERVFGRLKGRFPILKARVSYPYRTQVGIVLATCVLHNFIIDHNPNAEQFDLDEGASDDANESTSFVNELESATQSIHRGSNNDLRSSITSQMFMDFENCRI